MKTQPDAIVSIAVVILMAIGNSRIAGADADAAWYATWAAAPHRHRVAAPPRFKNQTLRQVIRVAYGGDRLRVRLSNRYGNKAIKIERASVAHYLGDGEIDAATAHTLRFKGEESATLAAGADLSSDPVSLALEDGTELAISLFIKHPAIASTFHWRAFQMSYITKGDAVDVARFTGDTRYQSWYWLTGVDVERQAPLAAVVAAIGDSTTDGFGLKIRAYEKWSSVLQQRSIDDDDWHVTIVNVAIGGNRLLRGLPGFGESMLARLERDAFALPGLTHVLALIGINDLGLPVTPADVLRLPDHVRAERVELSDLIEAFEQAAERCHERGVKLVLGTLPPFEGAAYFSAEGEAIRQQLNAWIRSADAIDGVVDFDAILRDPRRPSRLNPSFDSGDHLHPNASGHRAMARAVDLDLFVATPRMKAGG